MKNTLIILGSTGSIGLSTLKIINKFKKQFKICLLSTNSNVKLLMKQSLKFKVKNVIIFNNKNYLRNKIIFKKKKINVFESIDDYIKENKKIVDYTVNGISGIEGLEPTLKIIPFTKNIGIANKESLICGWNLISKQLIKYKSKFIPLDSEHFSIFSLINEEDLSNIKNIYLTASGGPFLNKNKKFIQKSVLKDVLNHPNWKMGKKISVDSASMMNKVFEVLEAKNIFNLPLRKIKIIIHPKSLIHAIVEYKSGITKFLLHEPDMQIPIYNFLFRKKKQTLLKKEDFNLFKLNGLNFIKPNIDKFPYIFFLNKKKKMNTFFDIILVTANDEFVNLLLKKKINFVDMQKKLLIFMKKSQFNKYYKKKPSDINDIKNMIKAVKLSIKKIQ